MTQVAHGVVQRLQVLLLLVTFQGQLRAQHLSADVTAVAAAHWRWESGGGSPCRPGTHNTILGPLVVKQSVSFISYVPFNPYQAVSTFFLSGSRSFDNCVVFFFFGDSSAKKLRIVRVAAIVSVNFDLGD